MRRLLHSFSGVLLPVDQRQRVKAFLHAGPGVSGLARLQHLQGVAEGRTHAHVHPRTCELRHGPGFLQTASAERSGIEVLHSIAEVDHPASKDVALNPGVWTEEQVVLASVVQDPHLSHHVVRIDRDVVSPSDTLGDSDLAQLICVAGLDGIQDLGRQAPWRQRVEVQLVDVFVFQRSSELCGFIEVAHRPGTQGLAHLAGIKGIQLLKEMGVLAGS